MARPIRRWVRKVIHEFNERGMDSLRPRYRGGRPRRITTEQRQRIVSVAGARPDSQGVPLTRWSLPRLSRASRRRGDRGLAASSRHAARRGRALVPAHPHLEGQPRPRLRGEGGPDPGAVRAAAERRARWSASTRWARSACARRRARAGRAAAGPSGSAPTTTAAPASATSSAPTTSTPTGSASGCARNAPAATCSPSCARSGSPTRSRLRIYWIQDNLSANWVPAIRAFAAANKIELVPTPTYASYLNPVECHFSALNEFVVANADYLDWDAFGYALANHVRYRNGDHRDRRLAAAEATTPHRRLMTLRVQPNFKGH